MYPQGNSLLQKTFPTEFNSNEDTDPRYTKHSKKDMLFKGLISIEKAEEVAYDSSFII